MRLLSALLIASVAFAADSVRLPEFQRQVFGNGVVLILAPKHDVPMMTARLLVRGGAESDPPGLAGLASLTAELLRSGTQKRSADQISREIDSLGVSYQTQVDRQATALTADFLSKDSDRVIDLLSDLFVRPAFSEAEVGKALARRLDAVRASKDNPLSSIDSYFNPFFFGPAHPYGRPSDGDEISLTRIARQDIVDYHKRMYAGKNLIVTVSGDFDAKALGSRLSILRFLGAGEPYQWKQAALPTRESARLLLVDKPDATQTYFSIAQPGLERANPDRVPMMLVNTLFGGRFTSMLNDELRVNSGLTYGARSRVDRDRLRGAISINTYTKTESTEQAIDLALAVLKRLREKGFDEEQLASAKAYVKGSFPTANLETDGQITNILGELELSGLNRGEIDDLFSAIDAVTLPRTRELIDKYFNDDHLQFVLVGNAARIQEAVQKYAPQMKVIPVKEPGFAVPNF